jgi:hypothetical protein
LIGAALAFVIKLLPFRANLVAKNELQKLQARISILRMNLKAKVKKRANAFRQYFAVSINPEEALDKDLSGILEVKFEAGPDFQQYFDYIKNIHSLITALHKDPDTPLQKYLEEDAKRELIIIRFVKEMNETSKKYNEKVEHYNKINPKQKLPIQFNSLADIEHILGLETESKNTSLEEEKFDAA